MSPLHHREPSLPGAAFSHPRVVCGLIADGRHVHPEAVALAFRMLGPDRPYLVTDAVAAAAGMGPGEHPLATRRVSYLKDGVPTLEDGTIAGSVLAMDEALRNILVYYRLHHPRSRADGRGNPRTVRRRRRAQGTLGTGYDADIAVLRPDLSVEAVFKGGVLAYPAG